MNATEILALLAVIVLILQNAARIPAALAELLDACQQVVHAARGLAAAVKRPSSPSSDNGSDDDDEPPRNPLSP